MKWFISSIELLSHLCMGDFAIYNALRYFHVTKYGWFGFWIMCAIIEVAFIFRNILQI